MVALHNAAICIFVLLFWGFVLSCWSCAAGQQCCWDLPQVLLTHRRLFAAECAGGKLTHGIVVCDNELQCC
jgi:hypothetical protein